MAMVNKESCNLLVKIDGKEEIKAHDGQDGTWKTTNGMRVAFLTVDQRLDCPDTFEVGFLGSQEGQRTVLDFAKEGQSVELGFGYDKPVPTLFKGEVIYVEAEYDATQGATVILRGYDHSHRLTRGHSAKTWGDGEKEEKMFSDVVSEVIQDSKAMKGEASNNLATDKVDKTDFKVRYVPKAMTTDYDFIKWAGSSLARASDAGKDDDKKISFRKLDVKSSPVATVCNEKLFSDATNPTRSIRCRFQISTYPIYAKVRVHGWNVKDKKAFVGEIESASPEVDCSSANSGWTSAWEAAGKAMYGSGSAGAVYERVADFCESKEEAEKIAQGLFDAFSLRYLTGEAEVEGCPEIVPGAVVEFKGFGDRVSGKVLVTQATHRISAKGGSPYTTTFQFCSNAAKAAR